MILFFFFSYSPFWKPEGILLGYLLWESGRAPGGKPYNIVESLLWLGPLGVFNSLSCPYVTSCNWSIAVQVFPLSMVPEGFLLVSLCSSKWQLPVFACLLQANTAAFPVFSLLLWIQENYWFSVGWVFYLLGWSGNFKLLTCRTSNYKSICSF